MKRLIYILIAVFSWGTTLAQDILPKPNPPRLVNDAANVLSPEQREILERKLVALDDSSSNQVAVVLIKTLNDYPIEDYAVKLFRDWGIGNKKTNNGVLIIAAIDDRKVRIEVGYGLEGALPDIVTASIIRDDIAPNFKEGNYYRGIDEAVESIAKAAVGEYKVKREKKGKGSAGGSILTFIILFVVVVIVISRGGGGRGGGMMSRRGYGNVADAILLSTLLNGGRGSGGGGFGGGGFGGGGGGGFGGFGGGSSGGGGASGSW
ncbi:TPM domain-containing protein [Sediminibacterium ginsengisoli]|nr:TPM domain-containing protein [Sediminibacterium ginsengisoli]